MLFVHGSLAIGGIETFYVRMAQCRKKKGLITKFLILSPEGKSDAELVSRARECADVYFLNEVLSPRLPKCAVLYHFSLLYPLQKNILKEIFDGISSAHVSNGFCAHVFIRLSAIVRTNLPVSIGLYHSMEFSWGGSLKALPFFEENNRQIFSRLHKAHGLIFFNEKMVERYSTVTGKDFSDVSLFPLGVVHQSANAKPKVFNSELTICSVGRLVEFKGYNLWMLDVVSDLRKLGIKASYHIYGYGPLEKKMLDKIKALDLAEIVFLKGSLEYSAFADVVSQFDVFVGSGTALVEAAGLGVPSLVGIENTHEPSTYGFLSELPGFSYNEDGLYSKKDVLDILVDFNGYSEVEKQVLSKAHKEKSKMFSVEACVENFEKVCPDPVMSPGLIMKSRLLYRLFYTGSFFFYSLLLKLKGRTLSQVVSTVE
jgi:1,2-diacylglycerol 3-alpha-glucosyltransferase